MTKKDDLIRDALLSYICDTLYEQGRQRKELRFTNDEVLLSNLKLKPKQKVTSKKLSLIIADAIGANLLEHVTLSGDFSITEKGIALVKRRREENSLPWITKLSKNIEKHSGLTNLLTVLISIAATIISLFALFKT